MDSIADIRKDYRLRTFSEENADPDPIIQFQQWWDEALAAKIDEANAMTLATVDAESQPSARIVLLKGLHSTGFVFFTNYESRKAQELSGNNRASLIFFWKELERQVRVEGTVEKIPATESDEYFLSRPPASRLGAWASPQSKVISSRAVLDDNVKEIRERFEHAEITRPEFWGGYILQPAMIEFWQGRASRLHDRLQYSLSGGLWTRERLAP